MSAHRGHDHRELDPSRVDEVSDAVLASIQPDGTWWINKTGLA